MRSIFQVVVMCLTLAVSPVLAQQPAQPAGKPLDLAKTAKIAKIAPATVTLSRSGAIKGAAIGFPIGAIAGVTIGAEACLGKPKWHCAVGAGLTYSAIGALIGWLH